MNRNLNMTKDYFVDTVLTNDEILTRKIKSTNDKYNLTIVLSSFRKVNNLKIILNDLLSQTYKNFEIIIVDDLSNNEIETVFEKYAKYENISYIKKQLGSKSASKNVGLDYARGEYILFIEENILEIDSNYLETMIKKINKSSADVVVAANAKNIDFIGDVELENLTEGQEFIRREILRYKNNIDSNLTSFIVKKQFLNIYNLRFNNDLLLGENIYFKIKVFDLAKKIDFVKDSSYISKFKKEKHENKTIEESYINRKLNYIKKIEEFGVDLSYSDEIYYLCGYLLVELAYYTDSENLKKNILNEIKDKINYFKYDSFGRKLLLRFSPSLFVKSALSEREI